MQDYQSFDAPQRNSTLISKGLFLLLLLVDFSSLVLQQFSSFRRKKKTKHKHRQESQQKCRRLRCRGHARSLRARKPLALLSAAPNSDKSPRKQTKSQKHFLLLHFKQQPQRFCFFVFCFFRDSDSALGEKPAR